MSSLLRYLFFLAVVRPLVLLVLGLHVRHRERLVSEGPAILVANHNSHLDTVVLMSLFPLHLLPKLRPVAAADYFLKTRLRAWFGLKIIGIVPIDRDIKMGRSDPLAGCADSLAEGDILILFPEGTRGEPERLAAFKTGVAHLAKRHPEIPVVPVFMHGLGKALPRGEFLLVPFFCDVVIGPSLHWSGSRDNFMTELEQAMEGLASEVQRSTWE